MRIVIIGALFATAIGANAQSCPQLGMNTVEEAENQFFQNRTIKAIELLDRAYKQCRNDGAVVRYIAKVYKSMGKEEQSSHYEKLADNLGARPIQRITEGDGESIVAELPTLVRRKYALVVGVSQFKDFSALNKSLKPNEAPYQRIKDLEFAAKDAKEFADALVNPAKGRFHPKRVKTLLNEEVTAERIRRSIAEIEQEVGDDDLVVLYFSSHGSSPDMDPATISAQSGFILTHDTEYRQKLNTATAYSMADLNTAITRLKAKRVVAFLDTCYSGDSVKARGARDFIGSSGSKGLGVGLDDAEKLVKATPQDKARVVITSSSANERSWESEKIKNGYFTHYLIRALEKDNGQTNISAIYRFLSETVPSEVEKEKGGAPQHPQIRAFPPKREINIVLGIPESEGAN